MKRQATDLRKIFAKHIWWYDIYLLGGISDKSIKGTDCSYYLIDKTYNSPTKRCTRDLNR